MDPFDSFFFVLLWLLFGCGLSGLAVVCYCFWCPDHFLSAPAPLPAVINIPPLRFVLGAPLPAVINIPPLRFVLGAPRPYRSPPPTPRTVLHPWS